MPTAPLLSFQPVFAPMLQSNPRMLTSGSHPQAIVSSSTPQYPSAEQPTPQALYGEFCAFPEDCSLVLSGVLGADPFPLSCCSHRSPVLSTPCYAAPCPPAAAGHHAYWEPAAVPACGPQSRPGACHGGSKWLGQEWAAGGGGWSRGLIPFKQGRELWGGRPGTRGVGWHSPFPSP